MARVSVVVPTRRRPGLLARCLDALVASDFDPSAFEVLIVDDAASEATRRQVDEAAARSRTAVRYLAATGGHGPAAARNVGWRAARGEIIAFTDDDCIPDRGWIAAGESALAEGVAAAATGRVIVPLPDAPTDFERETSGLERAEFVTANCFCRREAMEALGGFDERFTAAWREDSDLHFALIEAGLSIVAAPGAIVVHPARPARWGVSLGQQRKGLFDALLYKKHARLYRDRIGPGPPRDYQAIVAALAVAAIAAGSGRAAPALLALGAWGAMTGRFCARRLRGTSRSPGHVAEMVATSALIPPLSVFWRLFGAWKFRVPFA